MYMWETFLYVATLHRKGFRRMKRRDVATTGGDSGTMYTDFTNVGHGVLTFVPVCSFA
jgi:hypothetical protein